MEPKQIKIKEKQNLYIKWDDDSESFISLKYLRDECPCANCKGETILLKTYRPPKPAPTSPEMFEVKNIQVIGEYAIQITWKDGHNTGIYTWDYLKTLDADQQDNKKQGYDPLL